ncbi:uncharacterized protein METZ01_LOCUS251776 [marine metagenome]|uniref:DUF3014 domain-containing protein n=1 Tax=marine metagenome TaxID=408172 RepID=A0A382II21_9ZZZZ
MVQNKSSLWFIPILLVAGSALALWYYWVQVSVPDVESSLEIHKRDASVELPRPLHPIRMIGSSPADRSNLILLPPLDESDEYFKLEIVNLFSESIEYLLAQSRIIERVVATIDNFPRMHVAERIRPIGRLRDDFLVDSEDDSGTYWINASNYKRYDTLVDLATNVDLRQVVEVYRRYYPLFQNAYTDLGYPDGYFNDRLVQVIDNLIETPDIRDPVALVRPHVLYEYRDPELAALSSGQKLMLRMGRAHSERIKTRLFELRSLVTTM